MERVVYHGSLRYLWGMYEVLRRCDCPNCTHAERYVLRDLDPSWERVPGERPLLACVRPESFTKEGK